ncbi:hypothetical protein [Synechocystis sp. LKSZ1]|uniref:hypothetical protein n=1 Tax=Synechocystis sp. LKSZ1 TaxID=3144951 RepID=UPI00336BBAC2
MGNSLKIQDANTLDLENSKQESCFVLDFLTECITVREVIRSRVYQEVKDFNTRQPDYFKGLVQPTDTERSLNGYRLRQPRQLDWEQQFSKALQAFENNGFLILVGEEQLTELEDEITITPETTVTFLKLVPLVGG